MRRISFGLELKRCGHSEINLRASSSGPFYGKKFGQISERLHLIFIFRPRVAINKGQRLGFTPCGRLFYVAYTLHCTGTVYEVVLMVKPREHARSLMEREKIGHVEVDAVCARHVGKYLV